jgi:hypothetical protein
MRVVTKFDPVKRYARRVGKCPVCGKAAARQITLHQTLNPYNLNADGVPKTWKEIQEELAKEAKAWNPDLTHEKCKGPQETLDSE